MVNGLTVLVIVTRQTQMDTSLWLTQLLHQEDFIFQLGVMVDQIWIKLGNLILVEHQDFQYHQGMPIQMDMETLSTQLKVDMPFVQKI